MLRATAPCRVAPKEGIYRQAPGDIPSDSNAETSVDGRDVDNELKSEDADRQITRLTC